MSSAQGKLPTNLGPMMTDGMHCLQDRIKRQSSSREAAKQSASQNNWGGSSKLPKSRVARQPFHTEAHKAVAMDEKLARDRNWQPWAWDGKQDWSVARISVLAVFTWWREGVIFRNDTFPSVRSLSHSAKKTGARGTKH